jgi:hypothetical protein
MIDRTPVADNRDDRDLIMSWLKSSYSMSNGHCVEVARFADGGIGVRDSKAAGGSVLRFEPGAWAVFLQELRAASAEGPSFRG